MIQLAKNLIYKVRERGEWKTVHDFGQLLSVSNF